MIDSIVIELPFGCDFECSGSVLALVFVVVLLVCNLVMNDSILDLIFKIFVAEDKTSRATNSEDTTNSNHYLCSIYSFYGKQTTYYIKSILKRNADGVPCGRTKKSVHFSNVVDVLLI